MKTNINAHNINTLPLENGDKYILIFGEKGSGKTELIKRTIRKYCDYQYYVLHSKADYDVIKGKNIHTLELSGAEHILKYCPNNKVVIIIEDADNIGKYKSETSYWEKRFAYDIISKVKKEMVKEIIIIVVSQKADLYKDCITFNSIYNTKYQTKTTAVKTA